MSKRILAFGASSSKRSLNKQFATFASSQIESADITILDLNDFEMPIFSVDKEIENGIPQLAYEFKSHILNSDGIIISFAEHNGAYSAAFKNIFDWISRIEGNVWGNKPMLLLSTSPGGRGGQTVLDIAVNKLSRMTSSEVFHFSLPMFNKNFSTDTGIGDLELAEKFEQALNNFTKTL